MPSGERYWCVGGIDGAINFVRSMPEWTITVSLFEFNDQCSAQPILSVVHAPALGLTYGGARIRSHPHPQDAAWRQTREDYAVHHPVP